MASQPAWDTKRPTELDSYPLATVTHYEFGAAKGGPFSLIWYDGGILPPTPAGFPANLPLSPEGGVLFVGAHGMLMHETYGQKPLLIGAGLDDAAKLVPVSPRRAFKAASRATR